VITRRTRITIHTKGRITLVWYEQNYVPRARCGKVLERVECARYATPLPVGSSGICDFGSRRLPALGNHWMACFNWNQQVFYRGIQMMSAFEEHREELGALRTDVRSRSGGGLAVSLDRLDETRSCSSASTPSTAPASAIPRFRRWTCASSTRKLVARKRIGAVCDGRIALG